MNLTIPFQAGTSICALLSKRMFYFLGLVDFKPFLMVKFAPPVARWHAILPLGMPEKKFSLTLSRQVNISFSDKLGAFRELVR